MTDDRFSEDEIRQVFERAAAEVERARSRAPEGLTVDEMAEVGEASGIPRAFVEAAARQVRLGAPEASVETFGGVPAAVRRSVRLVEPPSDALWQRLVGDARHTFDATGQTGVGQRVRTWRNGNLRMTLEPDGDGSRLSLRTDKAQRVQTTAVAGVAVAFIVLGLALTGEPALMLVTLAALAVLLLGATWSGQKRWAAARAAQMADLTDRASALAPEAARDATPEALETPPGRIDLALFDDDPEPDLPIPSRRTRS